MPKLNARQLGWFQVQERAGSIERVSLQNGPNVANSAGAYATAVLRHFIRIEGPVREEKFLRRQPLENI